MFKGIGNFASLLKSAQEMGGKMQDIQEQLRSQRVTGNAGGGMVIVEANGAGEILSVRIEEELVTKGEREMIEALIPAAVNQALARANELRVQSMQSLTEGVNIPGLSDAIERFTGGPPGPPSP